MAAKAEANLWNRAAYSHQPYLMSSNSPSGGMKLMLRSESNLLSLTHWWKVQSSIAIDCFPLRHKNTRRVTIRTTSWHASEAAAVLRLSAAMRLLYRALCHHRRNYEVNEAERRATGANGFPHRQ